MTQSLQNPTIDDPQALAMGVQHFMAKTGHVALQEFSLPNGRRADLFCLGPAGEMIIIEVKSGRADFQADHKWLEYTPFCDQFYFAVSNRFPVELLPKTQGLIIADQFGGWMSRPAQTHKLNGNRRRSLLLRFGRKAAGRLSLA